MERTFGFFVVDGTVEEEREDEEGGVRRLDDDDDDVVVTFLLAPAVDGRFKEPEIGWISRTDFCPRKGGMSMEELRGGAGFQPSLRKPRMVVRAGMVYALLRFRLLGPDFRRPPRQSCSSSSSDEVLSRSASSANEGGAM